MMYRYLVKYGLKSDDRARSVFIVCSGFNDAKKRAEDIVNTFYDNSVEQGIIFDNTIDYYVEQMRDELAEKGTELDETSIWTEAYMRYYTHRSHATWYQIDEAY